LTTLEHKDKLLQTTYIQDKVIGESTLLNNQAKQALYILSVYIRDILANKTKLNSYQFTSLTNGILTYWNESINPDTEKFWGQMNINNISFLRKEPLRFALEKNRFRNVEQGIEAKNHWPDLKKLPSITARYTQAEIDQIDKIIDDDERKRLTILKKCLTKRSIPQTQYLKFGECMAYFSRCDLFGKYFSKDQVNELYIIWRNFKSK